MKIAALMAGKIKVGGQDSLLVEEPAYFDGMHSHVKYFVSLTLWVFHPAMRGMVILAIMDALKEDSDNIEIFFDIFTKAVAHYINEPEYIWDPHYIMMDQKGANFEAIERVFGAEFRRDKTKHASGTSCIVQKSTCRRHPKRNERSFASGVRNCGEAHPIMEYQEYAGLIHASPRNMALKVGGSGGHPGPPTLFLLCEGSIYPKWTWQNLDKPS